MPKELGTLAALDVVFLYDNNLKRLPNEIGNLAALTELNLGSNQLESVPAELGNLTALYVLGPGRKPGASSYTRKRLSLARREPADEHAGGAREPRGADDFVPHREPGFGALAGGGGTAQHDARRRMYHHHIIFTAARHPSQEASTCTRLAQNAVMTVDDDTL